MGQRTAEIRDLVAFLYWLYRLSWVIVPGLYWTGIGVLSMTPPDFLTARWLVSAACIWAGIAGGVWILKTNEPQSARVFIGALIGLAVFVVLPESLRYVSRRETIASTAQRNTVVISNQVQELQKVIDFFTKDEWTLREVFDYPQMVKFNLRYAKDVISPNSLTPIEAAETNAFFKDGAGLIDTRFLGGHVADNVVHIERIPGKVGVLNTSAKHEAAKKALVAFANSPQIPTAIQKAVADFQHVIGQNDSLMFDAINSRPENLDYIIHAEDMTSPFSGVIAGTYMTKMFVPLQPKAEIVLKEIKTFMKVD